MLQRNKSEADVFCDFKIRFKYLPVRKKSVDGNVLPFKLKLFRTKIDIKSVIRDYSLRSHVVNVHSLLKICKLSECSILISEDQRSKFGSQATNYRGLMNAM